MPRSDLLRRVLALHAGRDRSGPGGWESARCTARKQEVVHRGAAREAKPPPIRRGRNGSLRLRAGREEALGL